MESVIERKPAHLKPTARLLIEVYVARDDAGPVELILKHGCEQSGDTLLSRDSTGDGGSARYTVLLADHEHSRLYTHINMLIVALKTGLLGFACKYVPLLVEIQLPAPTPVEAAQSFPLKEQGSERYAAFGDPHTFYVSRPRDYQLDTEHVVWIVQHQAHYRVL